MEDDASDDRPDRDPRCTNLRKPPHAADAPHTASADLRPRVSQAAHDLIDAEMNTAFRWNVARDREIREALKRLREMNPHATQADRESVIQAIAPKFAEGLRLEIAAVRMKWRAENPPEPEVRDPEKERLKAERAHLIAKLRWHLERRKPRDFDDPGNAGVRHDVFFEGWDGTQLRAPGLPESAPTSRIGTTRLLKPRVSAAALARISSEMTAAFKTNVAKAKIERDELRQARTTLHDRPARTGFWQAVKEANPDLTDAEIDQAIDRSVTMERDLVLNKGLNLDQARELTRAELFPESEDGDIE